MSALVTNPMPTLADIASEAGVSLATASRVLSGSRDRVSDALAARVEAAARALHYVPNAHAQALARASSTTMGMIVHDVSDPYFAEIARGVLRAASAAEHLVMICNTFRDPDRELEYVGALRGQRVHSILLAGSGYTDPEAERRLSDELQAFRAANGRVASVGRHDLGIDAVQADNLGGGARVARHLLELGHTRMTVVAGPASLTTIEDRLQGFRGALTEAGIPLSDQDIRHVDFTRAGGYAAAQGLVDDGLSATAVFALNDAMAVGALAAFRDRGIDVPDDVSLVGFDDIPLAADMTPPLTTVRLPMEEFGIRAVELVLREDPSTVSVITTSSELVERASTAAPRPR